MSPSFGQNLERRAADLLNKVPGYRGYRAKEDRRDADRRVRDHVAAAYEQQADRVERVARDLANRRRLKEIAPVDEFAQAIRHLVDRIRTTTYGYGGLMSDRDVDETALDQLRQFDEGLLSGVQEIDGPIVELEKALDANGDLATPARTGATRVRAILARLDLRGEVIETGKPAPTESVLAVLAPQQPDTPPPAYDLHEGDALAILGDDYLVDSRIAVDADDQSFRLFRLSGGPQEQWLFVSRQRGSTPALLSPAPAATSPPTDPETVIAGTAYTPQSSGSGHGQVIGVGGESDERSVAFTILAAPSDPTARAVILDWGTERQVFTGKEVHPNDLDIFGRPNPDLN